MQETKQRQSPCNYRSRSQRGFAMAFVFVLVALLLLIAILVITGAFNANSQAQAVGVKYGVLNSAEAAANLALNRLAENPGEPTGCVTGSLNGATYQSCLGMNNINNPVGGMAPDYANGKLLFVPGNSAYVYGEATANGSRKVYVEAIAQPSPPLSLPLGALNAAQNINDTMPMAIQSDPLDTGNPNDATMYANNNITVGGSPSAVVQGTTHAVGTDSLKGSDGKTNSGSAAISFPSPTQISQAAQNAKLIAQSGTTVSGASLSSGGSPTLTGNVYVSGDVNITSGIVTFSAGSDVYINGNLCVGGTGSLANNNGATQQSVLVVNGVVASSGTGGYAVPVGNHNVLLSLAADPGAINPCGGSATEAISFNVPSGIESVGTVLSGNGSLGFYGPGTVQGAFDAVGSIDLIAGTGGAVQYDAKQSSTTLSTGTMTYTAYNQD